MAASCAGQERRAGRDLLRLGVAVSRGPALHDVADVDLLARETHRLEHLREELARAADEGLALLVLLLARPLADEHEARLRAAGAEDDRGPALAELAARAPGARRLHAPERGGGAAERLALRVAGPGRPGPGGSGGGRRGRARRPPGRRGRSWPQVAWGSRTARRSSWTRSRMRRPPRSWRAGARATAPPQRSSRTTSLSADVEADVGPAHVVRDDEVHALGGELGPGVLAELVRLGGEADEEPGALPQGELAQDVGRRREVEREPVPLGGIFSVAGPDRLVVRHGGGLDHDRRGLELRGGPRRASRARSAPGSRGPRSAASGGWGR